MPEGNVIAHWWHDYSNVNLSWLRGQIIKVHEPAGWVVLLSFFTTDRIEDPGTDWNSMGRSVLARSEDDGITFGQPLFNFSTGKFINLSLQVVHNESFPGLPEAPQGECGAVLVGKGG